MITIVDHIKDPVPFFTREEPPTVFKTTLLRQKYLAEEKRRWIEGYAGINGMLYFYATQIILKDRIRGIKYYPTVRDVEAEIIFPQIEDCLKKGESPFITKGRGAGLSSIGMNLPFYFFRTMPDTTCIATSKNKKILAELFTDKTMVAYDEMDSLTRPDLININKTANESFLRLGYKYIDKQGNERYSENKFICRDTQDSDSSTTNFSGAGAIYGFADEAPLMTRFNGFFNSARECFIDHSINRMVGLMLFGGTVEESIPAEGIQRIKQIFDNAKSLNIRPIFIPATYGKHVVNGHSNHEKAREEILRHRDELDKLDDKFALKAYIKNNPLSLDEIFALGGSGRFEDDVVDMIAHQITVTSQKEVRPKAYNITTVNGDTVANPVKSGPVTILELPKPNIKYWIGIDGTATGEMSGSGDDRSEIACVVSKMYDPDESIVPSFCPVAIYHELPKSIEQSYYKISNVGRLYNQHGLAMFCAEGNSSTSEHFGNFLVKEGLKKMIMLRKDLSGKGNVNKTKWFNYRNDATLDWQYRQANIFLRKYIGGMYFLELLQQMQITTNADILDAWLWCLVGMGADFDKPVIQKTYFREVIQNILGHDGKFKRVVKQISYDPKHPSIPKEKTEEELFLKPLAGNIIIDNKKIINPFRYGQ